MKSLTLRLVAIVLLSFLAGCSDPFEEMNRKGFEEMKAKAKSGDAEAQSFLGTHYLYGMGVAHNIKEAFIWYHKGAGQGNAYGQRALGDCYLNGVGVEQDFLQAISWYRKASEQGDAKAHKGIATCYLNGFGVTKDETEGYAYLSIAALELEDARIKFTELERKLSRKEIAAGQNRAKQLQKEIDAKKSAEAKKAGK
jgi:hypothetical protein